MTKPIEEQVAELEVGDWVEARFEHKDGRICVFTNKLQGRKPHPQQLEFPNVIIRHHSGILNPDLISITRVPRPIPQEPEVGSFALLDDGDIAQKDGNGYLESWRRLSNRFGLVVVKSWPEIYPHIVKLYTPSGDLVVGNEYAGGGE